MMGDEEMPGTLTPGLLAQVACLMEVTARKPGNVHRGRDFAETHFLDFLLSAAAIVGPLDRARRVGVGASVREAVEATRSVVATNTNLGMILLLAPMAAVPAGQPLAEGVADVLASTTIDDARDVYRAIRRARPGGLGTAPDQDVAGEPTVTLRRAMEMAADRDLVARQYADDYREVLHEALPALRGAIEQGRPLETGIVAAHLAVLARHPDTLIARKVGRDEAEAASRGAADVLAAGWPDRPEALALCDAFDAWLREDGHARNPGATADVVTAALFAALRDGTIPLPRPAGPSGWLAAPLVS